MLLFSLFFVDKLSAQSIDFKYKVDSVMVGQSYQYTITVNVIKGTGPFMIGVYENVKENLKELDKKENVNSYEANLTFTGRKRCIIFVRNNAQSAIKTLIYN